MIKWTTKVITRRKKNHFVSEEEESFLFRGRRIIFVQRKKNHFRFEEEEELPGDLRVNLCCSCNSGPRGPVELI